MGETECIESQKWKTYMCSYYVEIVQANKRYKALNLMSSIGRVTSG